tara:strand:+ start:1718 stop:2074 length:357 start_codon:yes stop_codon:yes gene_type:complete
MKTEPKPLGILLRKLRNEKKLTLRELGAKTNLTFGYLAQIERGLANAPSVESLCRIADALDTPQSVLLAEADLKRAPNAACIAEIYEHFKTNDSLSDNQFIGIAEKHELLFDDLSLRP